MSGLTEVQHLRAENARLHTELAAVASPAGPPTATDVIGRGVARVDRSIEILSAILDGPQLIMGGRLAEIGIDPIDPAESGMFYMGQLAASLLHSAAGHARADHDVCCPAMSPIALVRSYAQATAAVRDEMRIFGASKAGG